MFKPGDKLIITADDTLVLDPSYKRGDAATYIDSRHVQMYDGAPQRINDYEKTLIFSIDTSYAGSSIGTVSSMVQAQGSVTNGGLSASSLQKMVFSSMPPQSTTAQQSKPKMKKIEFKLGDRVKYVSGRFGDHSENPLWGGLHGKIGGSIIANSAGECAVQWDNGKSNGSYNALGKTDLEHIEKKETKKENTLDIKKLEPLVIAKEVRDEIVAVLKQHKNGAKLFDEWGLGEVIEYGRGMTFMFYGPPGTGKTWAANCIAKAMGTELLTIGAAEIQSQEPGGANRNIQAAFKDAKEKGKVLFIDECDSLITSRSEVGMILGSEINTLLTEIEKSEGVVILATNRIENMDEALERRISLIVEFPNPNEMQREEIWKYMLPKKMPLEKGITPERLAKHVLTGGQIKNVVLQAARLAMADETAKVTEKHFVAAINRINKSKNLMGTASRYREALIQDIGEKISTAKTRARDKKPAVDIDVEKVATLGEAVAT